MKQYKNTVHTIRNTVNTSTHITKTPTQFSKHPHITKHTHTHNHTLLNKLKQPRYKIHTYEIVTIQSSALSIMSP
jgi:hypothetical protein